MIDVNFMFPEPVERGLRRCTTLFEATPVDPLDYVIVSTQYSTVEGSRCRTYNEDGQIYVMLCIRRFNNINKEACLDALERRSREQLENDHTVFTICGLSACATSEDRSCSRNQELGSIHTWSGLLDASRTELCRIVHACVRGICKRRAEAEVTKAE